MADRPIEVDPDKVLGPIVTRGKDYVVRVKDTEKEVSVYIHRVENEKEQFPKGYKLGDGCAVLKK